MRLEAPVPILLTPIGSTGLNAEKSPKELCRFGLVKLSFSHHGILTKKYITSSFKRIPLRGADQMFLSGWVQYWMWKVVS